MNTKVSYSFDLVLLRLLFVWTHEDGTLRTAVMMKRWKMQVVHGYERSQAASLRWVCMLSLKGGKPQLRRKETILRDKVCNHETVAERISYFCLARNLIWPLGLTHNFTQSGWLILVSPDHLSRQHKLGNSAKHFLFGELLCSVQMSYCLLFNNSSSITPPWGKQSILWMPCVYFSYTKGSQLNMN